jgi:Xaa-Pro aminopeptidase
VHSSLVQRGAIGNDLFGEDQLVKTDLDRLMAERNLDAFVVLGDAHANPIMNYLTGGAMLERAIVLKRRGAAMTLVHGGMERDNAAATGLELVDRDAVYDQMEYLRKHDGNRLAAQVDYLCDVLRGQRLAGRVGVYGMFDAGAAMAILNQVQDRVAGVELVGEYGESLFTLARETKDDWEISQMREAGRLTGLVVGETQAFIQGHSTRDDLVIKRDGEPLTIGDVQTFTRSRVFAYGMSQDHHIFAQGRDAGVPHNSGTASMPLRLGQAIVFDIFPKTASGYHHDLTRTWCLGYAPEEVVAAWLHCKEIFDQAMAAVAVGTPCRDLQALTLDYFERMGHPTMRTQPGGHEGYVHSLGHGLGLDIHEEPRLSVAAGNATLLQPGHVVSVEPGLYYPERGFGVRIEDTVALTEDGTAVNLSHYPYDLIIPMHNA